MTFNFSNNLKTEDINMLNLRHLYEHFGYHQFKMNKFEEYDLYVANKDFLVSDNIVTFTDTNGKLLALKPDVTLSIVKNFQNVPGTVQKVYYNENIYRTSRSTKTYKEIMQMGLECIGDLDIYNICEVLFLAARSLEILNETYILDLSHMGVISGLLEVMGLDKTSEEKLISLLRKKSCHEIRALLKSKNVSEDLIKRTLSLAGSYGPMAKVLEKLKKIAIGDSMISAVNELEEICKVLMARGYDNIQLDFSIVNDMTYYNGVLFRGYVDGIPSGVLSGGQYDDLLTKMGRSGGAVGYAINMDLINNYISETEEYDVDVVVLYDKTAKPLELTEAVAEIIESGFSVTAQKSVPEKLRFRNMMKFENGKLIEIEGNKRND